MAGPQLPTKMLRSNVKGEGKRPRETRGEIFFETVIDYKAVLSSVDDEVKHEASFFR